MDPLSITYIKNIFLLPLHPYYQFSEQCSQWGANPNPDLIWIRFKSDLCLMDLDLDLRYFEKGGFDLDLKFIGFDLKKNSNPFQIHH